MQLGSTRQSVPSECLQPRRWPETFQEWTSQPRLVAHTRAAGFWRTGGVGSRILVSYMPLVHQRRPYPRLRRTLSQRAVPQRVVMVNYRSLPDKYANPLHNTAQKCDVVHLSRSYAYRPGPRASSPSTGSTPGSTYPRRRRPRSATGRAAAGRRRLGRRRSK